MSELFSLHIHIQYMVNVQRHTHEIHKIRIMKEYRIRKQICICGKEK